MLDEYYSKLKSKYFGYGKNLLLFGYVFFFFGSSNVSDLSDIDSFFGIFCW